MKVVLIVQVNDLPTSQGVGSFLLLNNNIVEARARYYTRVEGNMNESTIL